MTALQRWVQRPQSLWVRKALFQVHLWVGIGIGLYVLLISVSGSAIVYRRELASKYSRRTVVLAEPSRSRRRMTSEELGQAAQRVYPAYEVLSITEPEANDRPDRVILERRNTRIERLFDPYTGANLGNPRPGFYRAVEWLADLHDNLLLGLYGRIV